MPSPFPELQQIPETQVQPTPLRRGRGYTGAWHPTSINFNCDDSNLPENCQSPEALAIQAIRQTKKRIIKKQNTQPSKTTQ